MEGFASVFVRDAGMQLYCVVVSVWLGNRGEVSPPLQCFGKRLRKVFLECLVEFTREDICFAAVVVFLLPIWSVQVLFLLESVLEDCMFISRNRSICSGCPVCGHLAVCNVFL